MRLETKKLNTNQEASAAHRPTASTARYSNDGMSPPTEPVKVSSPSIKAKPPLTREVNASKTAIEPSDSAFRRSRFGTKKRHQGLQDNAESFSQTAILRVPSWMWWTFERVA